MAVRARLFAPLLAVPLVAAACGGASTYDVDKTRACLRKANLKVTAPPRSDFIAEAALGGSFAVRFRDNLVTVSFGEDRDGAERIVHAYEQRAGRNIGLTDVLRPKRNAVMLWAAHPSDEALQTIDDCLK